MSTLDHPHELPELRPFDWVRITTAELDQPCVGVVRRLFDEDGEQMVDVTTSFREGRVYFRKELIPLPHRPAPHSQSDAPAVELVAQ